MNMYVYSMYGMSVYRCMCMHTYEYVFICICIYTHTHRGCFFLLLHMLRSSAGIFFGLPT